MTWLVMLLHYVPSPENIELDRPGRVELHSEVLDSMSDKISLCLIFKLAKWYLA